MRIGQKEYCNAISYTLGLNIVFLFFYLILGSGRQASLDDCIMSSILTGANGSQYDSHLYFINAVYGFFLKPFYILFPEVGWYFIIEIAEVFVSFVVLTYFILKHVDARFGLVSAVFFLTCFSPDFYFNCDFTHCAAALTSSGIMLIFFGEKEKNRIYLSFAPLFLVAGFVMRKEEFLLGLPFLGSALFVALVNRRVLYKGTVISLIVSGVLALGLYSFDKGLYTNEEYTYYAEYQPVRAVFGDGAYYDAEAVYDELEERGESGLDFRLLKEWLFYDTEVFSLQKLQHLAKIVQRNLYEPNWMRFPVAFFKVLSDSLMTPLAWCWVVSCLMLLSFSSRKKRYYPWISFALIAMCFAYLLLVNRIVLHVESGIWLYATICFIPFFVNIDLPSSCRTKWVCLLMILASILLYSLSFHAMKSLVKDKIFWPKQDEPEYWEELQNYIETHTDAVFFLPLEPYQRLVTYKNYGLKSITPGSWSNLFPLGFWNVNLPGMKRDIEKYGIKNPLKDITKDNVYVVSVNEELNIKQFHEIHYGSKIEIDTVMTFSPVNILKFYDRREP